MKRIMFLLALLCLEKTLHAQTPRTPYIYTIKADSVKITNSCDTAELIIENHTQTVPGFLFNKGRGRTEFRRGLLKINDSIYIVGGDTLRMNPWLQGGNRFGTTGSFGTMDNNPIDFYTNGLLRGRWASTGNLIIGAASDEGNKLQVRGTNGAGVFINPELSREGDRIMIGNKRNGTDGQNVLIAASNDYGASYKDILVERDGDVGLGYSAPYGWNVGTPLVRCHKNGLLSFMAPSIYYGNTGGPENVSALVTEVSNPNEWLTAGSYPNGQNHYYFGTRLSGNFHGEVRAPLWIGGRELLFNTGREEGAFPAVKIAENRNVLIGAETDNGDKLQVYGNVYANGTKHLLGNLSIVSGMEPVVAGSAAGIRIDDPSNGSFIFQGTNQGWAHDMFVFTDTYNGLGQDVYFQDQSIIKIKSGVRSNNVAGNSTSMLNIQPEYNLNPATSNALTIRGIYYKPTLTSLVPGSKHVAIETVTGDVLFGTTSGNTGIGTNAPTAQLHTTGTVRFGGLTNNNSLTRILVCDATGNLYYKEGSSTFNGTLNSDLAVNGTVSAQKMLISQTSRWPDYVFSKQYKLPSLGEVETFINQNNHLPGIPSAAEVEKKGIDVANNQAALLKKIEELTLYIIEQEKTIQKQNDQFKELKQEMAELKALIKGASQPVK
jgi:uncharacterized coiled-coil protein SlyX